MQKEVRGQQTRDGIRLFQAADFVGMHAAGKLAAQILDEIADEVVVGQSTGKIDKMIEQKVTSAGAQSATIGYKGYRHASCISLNHVVCHGIPGDRVLLDGDIINIDISPIVDGWYGDSSRMFFVGDVKIKAHRLVEVTYKAMMRGISTVKPGATLGDIGHAIQSYAEGERFSVVRDFCGHGIGRVFHQAPNIMHFGRPNEGRVIESGMIFTIEPMINLGKGGTKLDKDDGWTAYTVDGKNSAQWEHTLVVTKTGCEILTHRS